MLRTLIEQELSHDQIAGDVTTCLLTDRKCSPAKAVIFAKEEGVFSGEAVCKMMAEIVDCKITLMVKEGDSFSKGTRLLTIDSTVGQILGIERTLLNFLSHLSGIASKTAKFVAACGPTKAKILATRKTLPGLREVQLQAVVAGGGYIHRRSLADGILIKENHQMYREVDGLIREAKRVRSPLHGIEVEVQNFETLTKVLENPPDVIMIDNFSPEDLREAVTLIGNKARVEVSGGVSLETVSDIAKTGVDYISVGALTHSVKAVDLSLDFI